MQIVIEIDEELYTALMNGYEEPYSRQFSDCVHSGTVLPDNPTNGDIIKAMFPYIEVRDKCNMYYSVDIENLSEDARLNTVGFRKDWWNAPYERSTDD